MTWTGQWRARVPEGAETLGQSALESRAGGREGAPAGPRPWAPLPRSAGLPASRLRGDLASFPTVETVAGGRPTAESKAWHLLGPQGQVDPRTDGDSCRPGRGGWHPCDGNSPPAALPAQRRGRLRMPLLLFYSGHRQSIPKLNPLDQRQPPSHCT